MALISADGGYSFDPSGSYEDLREGESATEFFSFTVSDQNGATVTVSPTITISGVNDAPVAVDDAITTDEDAAIQIDLAAGASDPDDPELSFIIAESGGVLGFADAVVEFSGSGDAQAAVGESDSVTVSLGAGDTLTLAFLDEIITDGDGDELFIGRVGAGADGVTVEVSADGETFQTLGALSDSGAFDLGAIGFTGRVAAARFTGIGGGDGQGFGLDFVQAIGVAVEGLRGDLTDLGGGLISYDPTGDFDFLSVGDVASETLFHVVTDGSGASDIGQITVTVNGVNDAPQGGFIFDSVSEDDVLTGNIFTEGGASDLDANDTLRTTPVNELVLASGALLTVAANGDYIYDPRAAFDFMRDGESADDSFTVDFDDGNGGADSVGASLTVTGVNDAPDITALAFNVSVDDQSLSIDLLDGAFDPEGDDLTVSNFQQVSGVSVLGETSLAAARFEGSDYDSAGGGISLGDVNGDGFDDFFVTFSTYGDSPSGGVLIFGEAPGADTLDNADGAGDGVNDTDNVGAGTGLNVFGGGGRLVAGELGDLNGDGVDDFLIADSYAGANGGGNVYVVFGGAAGVSTLGVSADLDSLPGGTGITIGLGAAGAIAADELGAALLLSPLGDVDGDGVADFLIGSNRSSANDAIAHFVSGAAALSAANANGGFVDVTDLLNAAGNSAIAFINGAGSEGGAYFGAANLATGDIDGDLINDLLIGSVYGGYSYGVDASETYIIFGGGAEDLAAIEAADGAVNATIDLETVGSAGGVNGFVIVGAANGLSVVGDVNGDGFADLLIDDQRFSGVDFYSGAVQVLFGAGRARLAALTGGAGGFGDSFDISEVVGTQTVSGNGLAGALDIDGGVSFNPSAFDALGAGEEEVLVFEFIVSGGEAETLNTLTITVNGAGVDVGGAQVMGLQPLEDEASSSGSTIGSDGAEVFFAAAAADDEDEDSDDDDGDDLIGDSDNEVIEGTNGADLIRGGGGDDLLIGMDGPDTIFGGVGDDEIRGGRGFDVLRGGKGDDLIIGLAGYDELRGGKGEDSLNGGNGNDTIFGGNQADFLIGGRGRDMLFGGAGSDRLTGGAHQDTLEGGAGQDVLIGSLGIDTFVFNDGFGNDRVMEFNAVREILDFSGHTGVSSLADLDIQEAPNGAFIFDPSGDRIFLVAIAPSEIDADNFLF